MVGASHDGVGLEGELFSTIVLKEDQGVNAAYLDFVPAGTWRVALDSA